MDANASGPPESVTDHPERADGIDDSLARSEVPVKAQRGCIERVMALSDARLPDGTSLDLPSGPPYACRTLGSWVGSSFSMPAGDPRLPDLNAGGIAPTPAFENLVGATRAWQDPDQAAWMDFLSPSAPNHAEKMLERALYLHHWQPWLPAQGRVLDLGGGTGRFMAALLDRGLDVELVDPDLRSLWRAAQHAAGRPGRLDLHWTTGTHLPPLAPVDCVLAAEVLCYVEDPRALLESIQEVLTPDGVLLASVEARWGWASALDAPAGSLEALLTDGVVHASQDRWVRTFDRPSLEALFTDWDLALVLPTHFLTSGPFELAAGELDLSGVLNWETRLRENPVTAPWHRAWTIAARPSTRSG